mmetsp:Transcript_12321/g.37574  ORF Transcript_12321/g.37574 Transcript_12321/m.37574 type:complete len:144 (+) Transcript_12321:70-501(+)|eukprot:CAMPEP_0198724044 /NCGR_PEP_ID=MMETSP1475-20131203/1550_1 /TAXON_ID= ORGANISM="Unidentified sp., Strain CCMP1999" /NCGR_SAMPLE_ID=MMETSP1475 /ASSEMBLY_ACC=CAM_ASM_001111 /LENGTH=143 /DNA_ID=CAMNT_0044485429 /DNA_START=28 /DNA_END=459 /DNA_ORIENTATION=+
MEGEREVGAEKETGVEDMMAGDGEEMGGADVGGRGGTSAGGGTAATGGKKVKPPRKRHQRALNNCKERLAKISSKSVVVMQLSEAYTAENSFLVNENVRIRRENELLRKQIAILSSGRGIAPPDVPSMHQEDIHRANAGSFEH